jgi:hypothetical protein
MKILQRMTERNQGAANNLVSMRVSVSSDPHDYNGALMLLVLQLYLGCAYSSSNTSLSPFLTFGPSWL